MRFLWELQNYFMNRLPSDGVPPERHEAMILCLLSFPAVDCKIYGVEDVCETRSTNIGQSVSIEMRQQKDKVRVSFSVTFGPQNIHVSAFLRRNGVRSVEVTASVSGKCEFVMELWRNDFSSRLERVSQWQHQNGLECSTVAKTERSISVGKGSVQLTAFGTGQEMRVWREWLSHRATLSLFEVQSNKFII